MTDMINRSEIEERIAYDQDDFDYFVKQGDKSNARECEIHLACMRAMLNRETEFNKAVEAERERCAKLCEMLASIHEASACRWRTKGSYSTRALWPLFKKIVRVLPSHEKTARALEASANGPRVIARCIRAGYDPDKVEPDPSGRVYAETTGVDGDPTLREIK